VLRLVLFPVLHPVMPQWRAKSLRGVPQPSPSSFPERFLPALAQFAQPSPSAPSAVPVLPQLPLPALARVS
jgi:hypothetical protein